MAQILYKINRSVSSDNYVLKGGTGLLLCHGLNRFSEDIDLDGIRKVKLDGLIQEACNDLDKYCLLKVTKDTDTVLRYMVDYGSVRNQKYPLKVEISFREKPLLLKKFRKIETINGMKVYSLKDLVVMKQMAFINRDKIRDFYDLYWFLKNRPDVFTDNAAKQILEALYYKGVEEITELLKDEANEDHILHHVDPEMIMIDFMQCLEKVIDQN